MRYNVPTMTKRNEIGIRSLKNEISRVVDEVRERGSEYVVTKHGKPVAVLRPWRAEDSAEARRAAVAEIMSVISRSADRVGAAAGRRSARAAVARQRR